MRSKWNKRYEKLDKIPPVSATLVRFYTLASEKRALDIACGVGHNALFLAKRGFKVDAIDVSSVALQKMTKDENIKPILADITQYELPKERYGLVFCANFLERSIFSKIKRTLAPNGILIYETFTYKSQINPAYALKRNELLQIFEDFEIFYYELKEKRAAIVAKKL